MMYCNCRVSRPLSGRSTTRCWSTTWLMVASTRSTVCPSPAETSTTSVFEPTSIWADRDVLVDVEEQCLSARSSETPVAVTLMSSCRQWRIGKVKLPLPSDDRGVLRLVPSLVTVTWLRDRSPGRVELQYRRSCPWVQRRAMKWSCIPGPEMPQRPKQPSASKTSSWLSPKRSSCVSSFLPRQAYPAS